VAHHGHEKHGHGGHEEHGLAHIASVKTLLGTWGILMVLTVVTVLATKVDLGSSMNLVVAMVIATIKATLVALYFMHLRYDRLFHTVVFASGLLGLMLFAGVVMLDRGEYEPEIIWDAENPPEP
jgi:cytochrome c oxidase subunit 4